MTDRIVDAVDKSSDDGPLSMLDTRHTNREFPDERTGKFGQRVELQPVNNNGRELNT